MLCQSFFEIEMGMVSLYFLFRTFPKNRVNNSEKLEIMKRKGEREVVIKFFLKKNGETFLKKYGLSAKNKSKKRYNIKTLKKAGGQYEYNKSREKDTRTNT